MTDVPTSGLVARFLEQALGGHIDEAVETLLAPEVVWDNPLPHPIPFGGRWEGPQNVAEYIRRLTDSIEIERFDVEAVFETTGCATLTGIETSLVKQTGRRYTMRWAHVVRSHEGRIVEWTEYNDTAAMLAAF